MLGAWQFLVSVVGVSDYLLPSPASIIEEFIAYWPVDRAAMLRHGHERPRSASSSARSSASCSPRSPRAGAAIDGMSAPVVAVARGRSRSWRSRPVLNTMFGADSQFGRQAIAALAAFVPVFINTLRGFRQTRPVHRDLHAGVRGDARARCSAR